MRLYTKKLHFHDFLVIFKYANISAFAILVIPQILIIYLSRILFLVVTFNSLYARTTMALDSWTKILLVKTTV